MARNKHRARGFTVVELMVALTVGGIAVSSLYAVGSASTRHFREQQRISTTQSSLRSAMNQIKRDFARAGFLGTPNASLQSEFCGTRPGGAINVTTGAVDTGRLAAISSLQKNVALPNQLDPDGLNPVLARIDDVTLIGNYSTTGEYSTVTLSGNRTTASIPYTTQSFRRDFTNWFAANGLAAGTCDNTAVANVFLPGRLVRVRNMLDTSSYAIINTAQCNNGTGTADIAMTSAVPSQCNATGGWISPLNVIRYRAVNAAGTEVSRVGDNRIAVLRRTEVDPQAKGNPLQVVVGGTRQDVDNRSVLDYLVRFQVDFLMHDTTGPTNYSLVPATQAAVLANPEWVRSAIIEIAARTSEHEPDMDVSANTLRLPPFRVLRTQGGARIRALRAEIFLPNIAYEGY
jgi:prepilin-type N-terminal cleavage/methylation domain-containing protein